MQPTIGTDGTPVEAQAEATLAAAAVTIETVQAAIEAESETAEDRQEELLAEVRKCLTKLEALSSLMERGAESPSLQQLLIQVGQMQTELGTIQTDLAALREEEFSPSNQEPNGGVPGEVVPRNGQADGPQNGEQQPPHKQESTSANRESNESNHQKSSPSATPEASKKKHYVKI